MPIDCVWFDEAPEGPWQPGSCFPMGERLSKQFLEVDAAHRAPVSVVLPGRDGHPCRFCVDSHPTDDPDGCWSVLIEGDLVAGERPSITVNPSIDAAGIYHGWLKAGVLSDDLGG